MSVKQWCKPVPLSQLIIVTAHNHAVSTVSLAEPVGRERDSQLERTHRDIDRQSDR